MHYITSVDPALIVAPLLNSLRLNGEYAAQLTADVAEDQKVRQPAEGMNHPAWLLSHLNVYHPVAAALLRGKTPADPMDHEFGMKSAPLPDPSAYKPLATLRDDFADGHAEVESALRSATLEDLSAPPPIERWRGRFGSVAEMMTYLLVRHESLHLGQLSAWRRAAGLPRV